jgi:hypothetical protein
VKKHADPELTKWCEVLSSPAPVETVPEGWLTTRQIAAELGKGNSTVGALLARAVREGRAERQNFKITSGQVTRPTPHYRLK